MTQTAGGTGSADNFDTSDLPLISTCGPPVASDFYPPQITITTGGGTTATYVDTGHVLDTGGFDGACAGDESHPWTPLTTVTAPPFDAGGQWSVTGTVTSGPQAGLGGGGTLVIDQVYGASQFTGSFTFQTTAGTVSGNIEDGTVSADTLEFLAVAGTLQDQVTVDLSTAGVTQMAGTRQDSLGNRGTMVATRSLRLSLAASTASAQVEQAVYLTAKLTDAGGYPIGGQPVDLRVIYASDAGLGLSAQTLITDASGEGVFTVTNDLPGTVTLQALYPSLAAAATVTWSGEVVISRVLLTASPSFIPADGLTPATLTATVYGESGQPLKGIPVTFASTLGVLSSSLTSGEFTNAEGGGRRRADHRAGGTGDGHRHRVQWAYPDRTFRGVRALGGERGGDGSKLGVDRTSFG